MACRIETRFPLAPFGPAQVISPSAAAHMVVPVAAAKSRWIVHFRQRSFDLDGLRELVRSGASAEDYAGAVREVEELNFRPASKALIMRDNALRLFKLPKGGLKKTPAHWGRIVYAKKKSHSQSPKI